MRTKTLAALLALALCGTATGQEARKLNEVAVRLDGGAGGAGAVPGGSATQVQYNNGGAFAGDAGLTYAAATDTLAAKTITANNITATALATPGAITVAPVLSKTATITTVAGSLLADGDYFTVEYATGLTVPVEFDLSPGNGTTGGRVPLLFTAGDSASTIRDNIILLLNAAAGTALTASSGGASTVAIVLDTPGAAGGTNSENVANAGFAISAWANPTAATTWTYRLVATLSDNTTSAAGAASSTAAGVATLSAANFNRLSWSAVTGATGYRVYRTVAGTSPATTGVIYTGTALGVDDVGLAGGGETAPAANTTGLLQSANIFESATNLAYGSLALKRAPAVAGTANTAVGYAALYYLDGGGSNTALGTSAGQSLAGAFWNTMLGASAQASSASALNRTSVGYNANATADHQVVLGDTRVTEVQLGTGGVAAATGSGYTVLGANGELARRGYSSELITLSTAGTTTDSVANLLPANAVIEAVVARITTTITTATDWKMGDATIAGRFTAANSTMTAGTTDVGLVHVDLTGTSGPRQTTAAKVRITTTGTPGAGAVRVTVFWRQYVAGTS